jgi:hypothetical protein
MTLDPIDGPAKLNGSIGKESILQTSSGLLHRFMLTPHFQISKRDGIDISDGIDNRRGRKQICIELNDSDGSTSLRCSQAQQKTEGIERSPFPLHQR